MNNIPHKKNLKNESRTLQPKRKGKNCNFNFDYDVS